MKVKEMRFVVSEIENGVKPIFYGINAEFSVEIIALKFLKFKIVGK